MTIRAVPRHGRPARFGEIEPVQWLVSGLGSCWRWVWAVDHDDLVSTVVAWLVQFGLLVTFFLAMVTGSG